MSRLHWRGRCSRDGSGVAAADFDNDGDLTFTWQTAAKTYSSRTSSPRPARRLYRRDGDGTVSPPSAGTSPSWGDYDKDGFLDLYVANHAEIEGTGSGTQDRLFHNNGNGGFTDVSYLLLGGDANGDGFDDNLGGYGFIASWTDYDADGDLDIFLINDCPFGPVGTKLFRNDGGSDPLAWNFTEVSASVGAADCRNGMGIAVGDYNRDSWFDYFYTNVMSLFCYAMTKNTFTDVTALPVSKKMWCLRQAGSGKPGAPSFSTMTWTAFVDLCVAAGTLTPSSSSGSPAELPLPQRRQRNLLHQRFGRQRLR
jgi:hypothetical protein